MENCLKPEKKHVNTVMNRNMERLSTGKHEAFHGHME